MSIALNVKLADLNDASDAALDQSENIAGQLSEVMPDAVHARQLQNMLVHAYSETWADEKLPIWQRIAVIVGAASMLWALIGAALYAVF